jgi:hypothetical protein
MVRDILKLVSTSIKIKFSAYNFICMSPHHHIRLCIHINLIQNMGLGLNILTIKQFMSFPMNTLRIASLSRVFIYIFVPYFTASRICFFKKTRCASYFNVFFYIKNSKCKSKTLCKYLIK